MFKGLLLYDTFTFAYWAKQKTFNVREKLLQCVLDTEDSNIQSRNAVSVLPGPQVSRYAVVTFFARSPQH